MGDTLESNIENPRNETEKEISRLGPWFHNLHLPDGVQTAPNHPFGDFPRFKWEEIEPHLPDISGWRVLDIGCNAGFYSFALAQKGAKVTAIDLDPHYLKQAKWAAKKLGLQNRVTFHEMQVYALANLEEKFDLIWFMGVLYHLRYPLLALDIITRKATELICLQTLTAPGEEVAEQPFDLPIQNRERLREPGWPQMAFLENRLAGDPTNWWAPTHSCIESMLRSCGFKTVARPAHEIYLFEPSKNRAKLQEFIEPEFCAATGQTKNGDR